MAIDWDTHLLSPLENVFGEPVNYRPLNGAAFDIVGIYDRAYTQEVQPLDADDPTINTTHPVLGVRDAEFVLQGKALPAQGDRVYITSEAAVFVVADSQPDSHGGRKLVLNKTKS